MAEEESRFAIGEFTFESFYEYRAAQEDVKKIECINSELDVQDPEIAIRLYNDIKEGKIKFNSPIGRQFADHVGDIVAKESQGLLDVRDVVEEADGQAKNQRVMGFICLTIAVVAFLIYGGNELSDILTARRLAKLAATTAQNEVEEIKKQDNAYLQYQLEQSAYDPNKLPVNEPVIDPATLTVLPEYENLYAINNELVGWLAIPDTEINHPVVLKENDNEFYLSHNFEKEADNNGNLFVDYRCDIVNPTTNTIIYGHNMRSGLMFGKLKYYLDKDYYNAHKTIQFNTIYEHRKYEIVAVCLSQVYTSEDNNFRYYDFTKAENEAQYDAFIATVKALSVFDDEINILKSDKLLTLSTCNSYTEDGRLFIVAKRVQ